MVTTQHKHNSLSEYDQEIPQSHIKVLLTHDFNILFYYIQSNEKQENMH